MHEIINALRDVFAETWFILMALAISFLAIRIGDMIADRRERKAAEAAKRRRLKNQHIEREIRNAEHAAAYRRLREQNDTKWAQRFGNTH